MEIVQRVAKAARETAAMHHNDQEAIARAAIATVFNWLSDPSEEALNAGTGVADQNTLSCRRMWGAILAQMRREAGF